MTLFRKCDLVRNIHQRFNEAGLMMGDQTHVRWLAEIATCCLLVAYILMIIFFAINARQDLLNSFDIIRDLGVLGIGTFKLISLRKNRDKWYCILKEATNIEKEQLELQLKWGCNNENDTFEFSEYIRVYSVKFQKISKFFVTIYKTTLVVFIILPFVEYGFNKLYGSGTDSWPHILACWSPLDDYSFAGYILTILIEAFALIYCSYVHIAFDVTSIGMMMFITGQFILLRNYSKNVGSKEDGSINKKRDDQAHLRIKICHNFHIRLTHLTAELRALLKNIFGVYFFIAALSICACAVKLNSEIKGVQLVYMLQYLSAALIQLFLFCYFGDTVLNESAIGPGKGPYGAAYWSLSPRIRKELLILAMGMSRSYQLYAGPFISVNLPTYIQVLRTAYSYYAVIRSSKE